MLKLIYDASGNLVSQIEGTRSIPQIIGNPVSRAVEAGENTSFSVVVSDANGVTFQWKFNGTNLVHGPGIHGATEDSLLFTNVGFDWTGQYSVEVKNSTGSVTSTPVALRVS